MRLTFAAGPEALKCGVRNSGCVITAKATGNQAETAKKAGTGDWGLGTGGGMRITLTTA
jgi:hypothetical protein